MPPNLTRYSSRACGWPEKASLKRGEPALPYILCVMTAYLKDEKEGSAAIRKISALAYSYFDRIGRASEYGRVVSPK